MDEYFFHLIVFGVLLALLWMDWSETKFQREKYLIRCTRIDPKIYTTKSHKPRWRNR